MSHEVDEYLRFPLVYFMGWEADGSAIVWSDGRTIVFREELAGLLRGLNTSRLPPLGAMALALAACRDNWHEPPLRKEVMVRAMFFGEASWSDEPGSVLVRVLGTKAMRALDALHGAWLEMRSDPLAKTRLIAQMCDGRLEEVCSSVPPEEIRKRLTISELWFAGPALPAQDYFLRDLRALAKAFGDLDPSDLTTQARTGLDQLVTRTPEPLALPPGGSIRDLLRDLEEDDDLGGVAKLARTLLAAVDLPRSVSDPDEFAQGGVSDIANRGELDRLLLSELAHDDLTLAVRVAMREALYLRREVPPRTPPRRRLLLVDSGVRMWGVPRVFATSVALALSVAGDERVQVQAYRSAGNVAAESDFATREGLIDHLAALDHRAQPGGALAALVGDVRRDPASLPADLVLITCDEVLADRDFQRTLEELELPNLYLVTVSREGELRIQERTPAGRRLLRKATLNLDDALAERPTKRQEIKRPDRGDLPAIFHVAPFPLRLSQAITAHRAWEAVGYGVLQLSKDGRLLGWTSPDQGGIQLAEGLGDGRVLWVSPTLVDGKSVAVIGKLSLRGLQSVTFDVATHEVVCTPLKHTLTQPRGVTGQGNVAFVFDRSRVEAMELTRGEMLAQNAMPDLQWFGQRFFREFRQGKAIWSVVSFDGARTQFTQVPCVPDDAEMLIEPSAREGFAVVTRKGKLLHLDNGWSKSLVHHEDPIARINCGSVARDGLRFTASVVLRKAGVAQSLLVYTLNGGTQTQVGPAEEAVEPALKKFTKPHNMRIRFEGIIGEVDGRILLASRRGQYCLLTYHPQLRAMVLTARPQELKSLNSRGRMVRFETIDSADATASLRVATWADGSRAWLDPRGLLHLRSSDGSIPECSIVLAEGETAGWAADGRVFGPKYFVGDNLASSAELIHRDLIRPFLERLR